MTTLIIQKQDTEQRYKVPNLFILHPVARLLVILILLSISFPYWIYHFDNTTALPDSGIWYLILLAFAICLMLLILIWKLFNSSWEWFGLPDVNYMVQHFKELNLWQQIILYWLSYALLLLAAIGSLIAIC